LLPLNDKGRRICLCAFITRLAKSEWQRAQNLSLRVYHSTCCSWMTKGAGFVSAHLSLDLRNLNDKGRRICLCAFITQLAALEWQRAQKTLLVTACLSLIERANDRNWSPHVIRPTASGWQKAQKTMLVSACYHALSLRDSKRKFKSAGPNGSHMSSGLPPLDDKRRRRRC